MSLVLKNIGSVKIVKKVGSMKSEGNMKNEGSMRKSVGIVMILTLFSRAMALLSNQFYLIRLGIDQYMNVFSFVLNLPNIVFTSIGTALTTVVVPIFASHIEGGHKKRAFGFVSNIMTLSFLFTIVLAVVGFFVAPILVRFTGFNTNETSDYAVFAMRCMFPVMIFYGMTFIFQGVLQSSGRFVAQAIVSLPGSIIVILYLIFWGEQYGVSGLIVATIIGLSFQVIIMIPSMIKVGFRFKVSLNLKDPDLRQALKLISPVFLGTSAWQLNMLFNTFLATEFLEVNGPTLTSLAQNLITSGVLTIVYSVTAVVFPKLTVLFSKGEKDEFKSLFVNSINSVLFFLVPLAFGFIILSESLLYLISFWGKITQSNIRMAGSIMACYGIGIIGHSIKEIADRAFYATKETFKPAVNGVVIMVVNIVASLILVMFFGVYGIPLGYSISLSIGAITILYMLKLRVGDFGARVIVVNIGKLIFASLIMIVGIFFVKKMLYNIDSGVEVVDRFIGLFVPTIIGVIVYFGACCALGIKETQFIWNKITNKYTSKI